MRFVDFTIRAWREGTYLQVIAHATPVGGMRHPVAVKFNADSHDDLRLPVDAPISKGADLGRELARLILPNEVWEFLIESLVVIAPEPYLGLRLRLCLDDNLIDLPWEFLYRPDVDAPAAHSGFLLMDGRISLVREPPSVVISTATNDYSKRGLFVGALFDDGSDGWGVKVEHDSLSKTLRPLKNLIDLDFVPADATEDVERKLQDGCDFFHYAGHTEVENDQSVLVQLARTKRYWEQPEAPHHLEAIGNRADWAWSDKLAPLLARGGTRFALFNACNSGFWPFVRPFMRVGVPALIGVQGLVSNIAALNFSEKLYQSLAVGLSLDEALTYARLYVMAPERSYYNCDWGRFMAYMPTDSSVLFPRSEHSALQHQQNEIRLARKRTIQDAQSKAQELDGAGISRMLSDISERSVLILGRFTKERKAVLDAIRKTLSTSPRSYVPLLFDFQKPNDRDLIESVVRFAAVSRFVIADLSDPKSVPAELQAIVPQFPSLPVVTIIEGSEREYPVADHILRRRSVVKNVVHYRDQVHLMSIIDTEILAPAEALYTWFTAGMSS
jgi:hypothetical protein